MKDFDNQTHVREPDYFVDFGIYIALFSDKYAKNDILFPYLFRTSMTFNQKTLLRFLSFLLVISVASAEQAPEDKLVRTGGIYLSEVQTNTEGTAYTSELLFAPDGRVFLAHHAVKIPLERLCKMLIPELDNWKWSRATSYRLEGNRLAFQTTSLNATSTFNGTIESGVLKMQLVVPTKNNLTYPLTFKFASCS